MDPSPAHSRLHGWLADAAKAHLYVTGALCVHHHPTSIAREKTNIYKKILFPRNQNLKRKKKNFPNLSCPIKYFVIISADPETKKMTRDNTYALVHSILNNVFFSLIPLL